jgi:hypothetical protein
MAKIYTNCSSCSFLSESGDACTLNKWGALGLSGKLVQVDNAGNQETHIDGRICTFHRTENWKNYYENLNVDIIEKVNKENTLKKEALLLEAFDKKIQSLVESGSILLLDQIRTQSLVKKRKAALAQGKKDAFTNETLSWGQIDSGATVNAHIESYADGHSEMVVGLAKPNSHSQKETIYTEKVKKQK